MEKENKITEFEFTRKNKNNVCNAIDGSKSFKKLSAAEWHQFVQNYNYDNGNEPFIWLIGQELCDKGTALCLYWHLQPDYYCNKTIDENDTNYEDYRLLKEIEQRFADGFYKNEQFSFDPSNEFLTNETEINGIPEEMLQKTNGIPFDRVDVEVAWLRYPNEKERKTIEKKINNAVEMLQQLNPAFVYEKTDLSVEAIANAVQHFKEEPKKLKDLSFLWLDCVHKKYAWDWIMWDCDTAKAAYGVSSSSKMLTCLEERITNRSAKTIRAVFQSLNDIEGNLGRFYKHYDAALLFETSHLKFKD